MIDDDDPCRLTRASGTHKVSESLKVTIGGGAFNAIPPGLCLQSDLDAQVVYAEALRAALEKIVEATLGQDGRLVGEVFLIAHDALKTRPSQDTAPTAAQKVAYQVWGSGEWQYKRGDHTITVSVSLDRDVYADFVKVRERHDQGTAP